MASAKVMFGAPVEAKYQDRTNAVLEERIKRLEVSVTRMHAKLDMVLQYLDATLQYELRRQSREQEEEDLVKR